MPTDLNSTDQPGLVGPCEFGAAITPNDSTDLTVTSRAIYVGGGGDIALITKGGSTITLAGAAAGSVIPIRAVRIKATGTTATSLVAIW